MRRNRKPPTEALRHVQQLMSNSVYGVKWRRFDRCWEGVISGHHLVRVWEDPEESVCRIEVWIMRDPIVMVPYTKF
jgi:hypothetical protein